MLNLVNLAEKIDSLEFKPETHSIIVRVPGYACVADNFGYQNSHTKCLPLLNCITVSLFTARMPASLNETGPCVGPREGAYEESCKLSHFIGPCAA